MEPFDESKHENKFWTEDPFDKHLPLQKGFITDMVYNTRGTELPTIFAVWAAVVAIAAAVKREAWCQWYPGKFFSNFYLILIAPPSICKKGLAIDLVDEMLTNIGEYINDRNIRQMKKLNIVRNRSTPEALLDAMQPSKKGGSVYYFLDENGHQIQLPNGKFASYERTSEMTVLVPELGTFISRAKYNEDLLNILTDIYDTKTRSETRTKGGGVLVFKNLCTNIIGATTPKAFRETMPKIVLGDGFMSRTVLAFQDWNPRRFMRPRAVPGAPTIEDLTERLAYIAENSIGEHSFTEEADSYYAKWYNRHKDYLENTPTQQGILGRKDTILQKLSLIMHVQKYAKPDDILISLDDLLDAERIIDATYARIPRAVALISKPEYWERIVRIERYIKSKGSIRRTQLMQNQHLNALDVNQAIDQLMQEGKIKIFSNGREQNFVRGKAKEEYHWCGGVTSYWEDEENG